MQPTRYMKLLLGSCSFFACALVVACSGGDSAPPTTSPGYEAEAGSSGDAPVGAEAGAARTDAGLDAAPVPASRTVKLASCKGMNGVAEACTIVENATACTGAKCSKLALLFSGGEEGCGKLPGYTKTMEQFAADGWAVACISTFETGDGSDAVPYVEEAMRIDASVKEVTAGPWAAQFWTGERLLFAGISHGATAPPIVMARTALDNQPQWKGTKKTAACFFDGSMDQAATASLLATGALGEKPCTTPVSYQRWLERYCGKGATSCDLTTNAKSQTDTITDVIPAQYAVPTFKMIECGSALRACAGDILPAPPIQATCSKIDSGPEHTCMFESIPGTSHLTCFGEAFERCGMWFDAL